MSKSSLIIDFIIYVKLLGRKLKNKNKTKIEASNSAKKEKRKNKKEKKCTKRKNRETKFLNSVEKVTLIYNIVINIYSAAYRVSHFYRTRTTTLFEAVRCENE